MLNIKASRQVKGGMKSRNSLVILSAALAAFFWLAAPDVHASAGSVLAPMGSVFGLTVAGGAIADVAMGIFVARQEPSPGLFGTGLALGIINMVGGSLLLGFAHQAEGSLDIVMYSVGGVFAAVGVVGVVLGLVGLLRYGSRSSAGPDKVAFCTACW
jgi:hypothetical protein